MTIYSFFIFLFRNEMNWVIQTPTYLTTESLCFCKVLLGWVCALFSPSTSRSIWPNDDSHPNLCLGTIVCKAVESGCFCSCDSSKRLCESICGAFEALQGLVFARVVVLNGVCWMMGCLYIVIKIWVFWTILKWKNNKKTMLLGTLTFDLVNPVNIGTLYGAFWHVIWVNVT